LPFSTFAEAKALKSGGRISVGGLGSPNPEELCDTHLPRVLLEVEVLNSDPFSVEKAS
jgi:hypothetical protein